MVDDRHLFVTDGRGRVVHVETTLDPTPGERNGYQQRVSGREFRLALDQGGHLVATRFGGPREGINLVPMSRELNGPGTNNWYAMEREWARLSARTRHPRSGSRSTSTTLMPLGDHKFVVRYAVDGEIPIRRVFRP